MITSRASRAPFPRRSENAQSLESRKQEDLWVGWDDLRYIPDRMTGTRNAIGSCSVRVLDPTLSYISYLKGLCCLWWPFREHALLCFMSSSGVDADE